MALKQDQFDHLSWTELRDRLLQSEAELYEHITGHCSPMGSDAVQASLQLQEEHAMFKLAAERLGEERDALLAEVARLRAAGDGDP